jgi:Protein of unknown function (DUF4236)
MGFRFRKYFEILPGVRVNLGRKRVSVSLGKKGLTANISKDGIRKTVSLPGTGLSYSSYQKHSGKQVSENEIRPAVLHAVIFAIVAIATVIVAVIVMLLKSN